MRGILQVEAAIETADISRSKPKVLKPKKFERMIQVFGDGTRRRLLGTLRHAGKDGMSVTDLVNQVGTSQANISRLLTELSNSDIVESRRSGRNVVYWLLGADESDEASLINDLFDLMQNITGGKDLDAPIADETEEDPEPAQEVVPTDEPTRVMSHAEASTPRPKTKKTPQHA